jgi:hypothetical protein
MKTPEKTEESLYRAEVAKRLHIYDIFAEHEVAYSLITELEPNAAITQRSYATLMRLALYEIGKNPNNADDQSEAIKVLNKLVEYSVIQKNRDPVNKRLKYSLTNYGITNFGDFMVFLRLLADFTNTYDQRNEYKNGTKAYKEISENGLATDLEVLYSEGEVDLLKIICDKGLAYPLMELLVTQVSKEIENTA